MPHQTHVHHPSPTPPHHHHPHHHHRSAPSTGGHPAAAAAAASATGGMRPTPGPADGGRPMIGNDRRRSAGHVAGPHVPAHHHHPHYSPSASAPSPSMQGRYREGGTPPGGGGTGNGPTPAMPGYFERLPPHHHPHYHPQQPRYGGSSSASGGPAHQSVAVHRSDQGRYSGGGMTIRQQQHQNPPPHHYHHPPTQQHHHPPHHPPGRHHPMPQYHTPPQKQMAYQQHHQHAPGTRMSANQHPAGVARGGGGVGTSSPPQPSGSNRAPVQSSPSPGATVVIRNTSLCGAPAAPIRPIPTNPGGTLYNPKTPSKVYRPSPDSATQYNYAPPPPLASHPRHQHGPSPQQQNQQEAHQHQRSMSQQSHASTVVTSGGGQQHSSPGRSTTPRHTHHQEQQQQPQHLQTVRQSPPYACSPPGEAPPVLGHYRSEQGYPSPAQPPPSQAAYSSTSSPMLQRERVGQLEMEGMDSGEPELPYEEEHPGEHHSESDDQDQGVSTVSEEPTMNVPRPMTKAMQLETEASYTSADSPAYTSTESPAVEETAEEAAASALLLAAGGRPRPSPSPPSKPLPQSHADAEEEPVYEEEEEQEENSSSPRSTARIAPYTPKKSSLPPLGVRPGGPHEVDTQSGVGAPRVCEDNGQGTIDDDMETSASSPSLSSTSPKVVSPASRSPQSRMQKRHKKSSPGPIDNASRTPRREDSGTPPTSADREATPKTRVSRGSLLSRNRDDVGSSVATSHDIETTTVKRSTSKIAARRLPNRHLAKEKRTLMNDEDELRQREDEKSGKETARDLPREQPEQEARTSTYQVPSNRLPSSSHQHKRQRQHARQQHPHQEPYHVSPVSSSSVGTDGDNGDSAIGNVSASSNSMRPTADLNPPVASSSKTDHMSRSHIRRSPNHPQENTVKAAESQVQHRGRGGAADDEEEEEEDHHPSSPVYVTVNGQRQLYDPSHHQPPAVVFLPHFPSQLHDVLSNSDHAGTVLEWLPHGQGWRVLRWDEMQRSVLPSYFPELCTRRISPNKRHRRRPRSDDANDQQPDEVDDVDDANDNSTVNTGGTNKSEQNGKEDMEGANNSGIADNDAEPVNCFLQQVNAWGFTEVKDVGPDMGSYRHSLFLRGNPDLCLKMRLCTVTPPVRSGGTRTSGGDDVDSGGKARSATAASYSSQMERGEAYGRQYALLQVPSLSSSTDTGGHQQGTPNSVDAPNSVSSTPAKRKGSISVGRETSGDLAVPTSKGKSPPAKRSLDMHLKNTEGDDNTRSENDAQTPEQRPAEDASSYPSEGRAELPYYDDSNFRGGRTGVPLPSRTGEASHPGNGIPYTVAYSVVDGPSQASIMGPAPDSPPFYGTAPQHANIHRLPPGYYEEREVHSTETPQGTPHSTSRSPSTLHYHVVETGPPRRDIPRPPPRLRSSRGGARMLSVARARQGREDADGDPKKGTSGSSQSVSTPPTSASSGSASPSSGSSSTFPVSQRGKGARGHMRPRGPVFSQHLAVSTAASSPAKSSAFATRNRGHSNQSEESNRLPESPVCATPPKISRVNNTECPPPSGEARTTSPPHIGTAMTNSSAMGTAYPVAVAVSRKTKKARLTPSADDDETETPAGEATSGANKDDAATAVTAES